MTEYVTDRPAIPSAAIIDSTLMNNKLMMVRAMA